MTTVTDQTRNAVWQNLLDAERYVRYFGALADRFQTRHRLLRYTLLVSVIVEATVFIPNMPDILFIVLTAALGIVIIGLAAWDAVSDYGKNAAVLTLVTADCALLKNEWDELWMDIETFAVDEPQARDRRRGLERRLSVVAERTNVNLDESLNDSCEEEAFKVVEQRYAS